MKIISTVCILSSLKPKPTKKARDIYDEILRPQIIFLVCTPQKHPVQWDRTCLSMSLAFLTLYGHAFLTFLGKEAGLNQCMWSTSLFGSDALWVERCFEETWCLHPLLQPSTLKMEVQVYSQNKQHGVKSQNIT
jgi:hypothetical protein